MKIYDCFQFFNELDLLEIRLELLYDYVDYFVISETNKTHSDVEKPLYFEENKDKFKKFLDKIIHVKHEFPENILNMGKKEGTDKYSIQYNIISEIYDIEENEGQLKSHPTFCRDYLQKEFIKFGLMDCKEDDIIMISDLDEIPNPEIVKKIKDNKEYNTCLLQNCFYYHINTLAHTNWYGNYIVKYEDTKNVSLTHLKNKRLQFNLIENAGWHFSFMGGPNRVIEKIKAYAHQEMNIPHILSNVELKINSNVDLYNRRNNTYRDSIQEFYFDGFKVFEINNINYPEKMIEIIRNKFPYLIK